MGYISVLITELNLVKNHRRNMLMSTEWYERRAEAHSNLTLP